MFEGEINLYVIAGDPLTLIDTGIGTPEALAALEAGLAGARPVDRSDRPDRAHAQARRPHRPGRDIHDRCGAHGVCPRGRLGRRDQSRRAARASSFRWCASGCAISTRPRPTSKTWRKFLGHGKRFARADAGRKAARRPDACRSTASDLEVIHTPGHTQGSISLRYGRHLFSGDHVLPTISPNIGAGELRRSGMMRRFLDSLDRVANYSPTTWSCCPGTASRFRTWPSAAASCERTTDSASRRFSRSLRGRRPKTVYEVARALWTKLPGYHLALGTAEVNAHLEKSVEDGAVREEDGRFSYRLDCAPGRLRTEQTCRAVVLVLSLTTTRPAEVATRPAWSAQAAWSWAAAGPVR